MKPVADSGNRVEEKTGGLRDRYVGKGRFDLISPIALLELSKYCEICVSGPRAKYPPRNWEKGLRISQYIDSAIRHLVKLLASWTDEDHALAAFWNCMCLVHTIKMVEAGRLPRMLMDDLPTNQDIIDKIKSIKNRGRAKGAKCKKQRQYKNPTERRTKFRSH